MPRPVVKETRQVQADKAIKRENDQNKKFKVTYKKLKKPSWRDKKILSLEKNSQRSSLGQSDFYIDIS